MMDGSGGDTGTNGNGQCCYSCCWYWCLVLECWGWFIGTCLQSILVVSVKEAAAGGYGELMSGTEGDAVLSLLSEVVTGSATA